MELVEGACLLDSDASLVCRTLAGDQPAYAALVERYARTVYAAARAVLGDHHAAEYAAQDAFVLAYQKLRSLREPAVFGPWVLSVARRRAIRIAQQTRATAPLPATVAAAAEQGSDPAHQDLLQRLMDLPEQEASVVMLRYFDGRSTGQIARITGRPVGTVTKQLSRAVARLRRWLKGDQHASGH